jgi:hypothetical protein
MATIVIRQLTTPPVYPLAGLSPFDQFAVDSLIASLQSQAHGVDSYLALHRSAAHALDSLLAGRHNITFSVSSAIGLTSSKEFALDSFIVPQPGVAIFGPGPVSWTAPGGITSVNAFLWSRGGFGAAGLIGAFSSRGGGGGGFAAKWNCPCTPGNTYFGNISPPDIGFLDTMYFDGSIGPGCSRGVDGQVAAPNVGGNGFGGDLNYQGGTGGIGHSTTVSYGGGGGSCAGPSGNGHDGGDGQFTSSGGGGPPSSGMGAGGWGGNPNVNIVGHDGFYPGGGAGGGGAVGASPGAGGQPGGGLLILTWDAAVHFVDSCIVKPVSAGHQIDSLLSARVTIAHSIDSAISQRRTLTHAIDSLLVVKRTLAHSVDSLLSTKRSGTHALTSLLSSRVSITHSLTSLLAKAGTAIHGLTSLIGQKISATFGGDCCITKVYLQDNFVDSDNTLLSAHTMNVGPGWTIDTVAGLGTAADAKIVSNAATNVNSVGLSVQEAVSNASQASAVARVAFYDATVATVFAGLLGRYSDSSNRIILYVTGTTFRLSKVVAGAETILAFATLSGLTNNVANTLTLTFSGNTLSGSILVPGTGTTTLGPVTDSFNNTATKWGLQVERGVGGSSQTFYQNFSVKTF